jgi:Fic family protein
VPLGTSWLLSDCAEYRGKQELWLRQKPEVIRALRELAMVQSVESSNRIEGVTVQADRVRPLVLGGARPRDRSEEELAGYRRALEWIYSRKHRSQIKPAVVQHLHKLAQHGAGDAGKFKARDNEIVEVLVQGGRRVRFRPVSAKQTPAAMRSLCRFYRLAEDEQSMPPLLAIATFVLDLLCIHPFRDGNGRVSRLVTNLLIQQEGFEVARYISIERLVEERKEEYYAVLHRCSTGWHVGENELAPWWNFFLGVLRSAYQAWERRMERPIARPTKSDLIRSTILSKPDAFTLADLTTELPSSSPQLIRKVLSQLKSEGRLRLEGRGRGAVWRITGQD